MSLLCGFLSLGDFFLSFTPLVFASFRMRGRRGERFVVAQGRIRGNRGEENSDARSKTKIKTGKITELWQEAV